MNSEGEGATINHLTSIRQLTSEVASRLQLLFAHMRALRQAPPPESEAQARLWTDLELLAIQLRGLAAEVEQVRLYKVRAPEQPPPSHASPRM